MRTKTFMTGKWEDLIISTYEVEKEILEKYLPLNTELQLFEGKALMSMVAFTFADVKFFGMKIPFHQKFGEINYRFYVKSKITGDRGVVFLKEYASKPIMAFIANRIYNEPFFVKGIRRKKEMKGNELFMSYNYPHGRVHVSAAIEKRDLEGDSLEHFIVDRYIAFVKNRKKKTTQYKINHKPWKLYKMNSVHIDMTALSLLPTEFNRAKYISTYFVDGSSISVEKGILQQETNTKTVIKLETLYLQ
ncbi:MAG: DUF2071 domain-containing protein [Urechidicola sp.]|nr:DUF2071 domain-containing protein [Urechidicola sp.]